MASARPDDGSSAFTDFYWPSHPAKRAVFPSACKTSKTSPTLCQKVDVVTAIAKERRLNPRMMPHTKSRSSSRGRISPVGFSAEHARCVVVFSFSSLALFTLTTDGFDHAADSGAGLALALWVVASHTAYNISAYNVAGFSSYLFVPYHDVLEGTQSLPAFVGLVVLVSLFHTALVTTMSLSMFFTIGIDGPPLMLPTFVAGVSLWVFGVFGFIALIMGLETLFSSCRTRIIFHSNEQTFRRLEHPVSQSVSDKS